MCGGNYNKWETPRQLMKVNGEIIVERTIRLLKENGIKDIAISTNNPEFEYLNIPILKHENNFRVEVNKTIGYWCNAFYPTNEPTCYIFGDVYFSDEAIKTIVNTNTDDIEFFGSMPPYAKNYPKNHVEPFALKVVNTDHLKSAIQTTKELEDEGKFWRKHCMWELWTVIKNVPLQTKPDEYIYNYIAINDITCDVDNLRDVELIENMINKKIEIRREQIMKIRALRDYTDNVLKKEIKKGDEYEVSNERGKQILSHPKNLAMLVEIVKKEVEVLEEAKELKEELKGSVIAQPYQPSPYKNEKTKPKTTTKKKVTKKK